MAVDIFLLIFVPVVFAGAVFVNVRLLLHFQGREESQFASSVLCKAIIVMGLTLAWLVNILLPIDVRNSRPNPGPLDMQSLWAAAFISLAVFVALLVPGALFYNEVEGDDLYTPSAKRRHVLCHLFLTCFLTTSAVAITYPFLAGASIPVQEYECDLWQDADAGDPVLCPAEARASHLDVEVGFEVYIIAVLCFIGWFFFVTFGGIGLSAVPIDLIFGFIDRPQKINEATYQQRRQILSVASQQLLQHAEALQERDGATVTRRGLRGRWQQRGLRADYNRFQRDVCLVEDELERLNICKFQKGENLLLSVGKLLLGIACAVLSLMWVLHIFLCIVLPHIDENISIRFLNKIFSAFESGGFFPAGVALFAVFSLYLIFCVVQGCLKFGMRIFFFFSIHPMRPHGTPLNSILFNVEMVLISSAAVVQFVQTAFADYAHLTDAEVIFSAQIKHMSFYSWFFRNNVFIYALLAWFLVALIYLLVRPRDRGEVGLVDKKTDKRLAQLIGATLSQAVKGTKDEKR